MQNLCPAGIQTQWLRTSDGVRLRAACWPADKARGTIVLLQGRTECIEKYYETIGELRVRGFAVAAFDWRGQGLSDRALADNYKGYVWDFSEYLCDMDCFMDSFVLSTPGLPPPYIMLAHSMGAHIAVRCLHDRSELFGRAILCSPMAYINTAPLPHFAARAIAYLGARLGYSEAYVPGGGVYDPARFAFEGNPLTGDKARFERNAEILAANPDLVLGGPTLGWLEAAFRSMAMAITPEFCVRIETPCLLLYGDRERVSLPAFQALLGKQLGNCESVCVPGARHEILQETDEIRTQFWLEFDRFMPATAPKIAPPAT